jgi:hypothetical protein
MSILDKIFVEKTPERKYKYINLKSSIKKIDPNTDIESETYTILRKFKAELIVTSSFLIPEENISHTDDLFQSYVEKVKRQISNYVYEDIIKLIHELELALINDDIEEMFYVLKELKKEVGIAI